MKNVLFRVRVTLGDYNFEIDTQDCVVTADDTTTCAPPALTFLGENIAPHPKYDKFSLHHDIAIIQLSGTVQFTGE